MYEVTLTEAYFPAQRDIDVREITVGGLLRETAARRAEALPTRLTDDRFSASARSGRSIFGFPVVMGDCYHLEDCSA